MECFFIFNVLSSFLGITVPDPDLPYTILFINFHNVFSHSVTNSEDCASGFDPLCGVKRGCFWFYKVDIQTLKTFVELIKM